MNQMKIAFMMAISLVGTFVFARDPLYVDKESPNASDAPGTPGTEALPFKTIQGAVDQAESGDLILVKPGFYDEGGRPHVENNVAHTNRLYLTTENLTIRSTKGTAVTHIVGTKDYTTADPGHCGPAAIRCVYVYNAKGSILQGFTLRDGASDYSTKYSDEAQYQSGGVAVDISSDPYNFYLVDCVVSNCAAYKGTGIRNGTGIRCLFANNEAVSTGAASGGSRLLCCVASGNRATTGGWSSVFSTCVAFNCTLVGNAIADFAGTNGKTYNCLCYGNASDSDTGFFTNTLRTAAFTRPPVMSPATGDFRPVDPAAIGAGEAELLSLFSAPAELTTTDFAGNPLPSSGAMDVGAVQGLASPVAGALVFKSNAGTADGVGVSVNSWIRPTAFPTQFVVRADVPSTSHVFGLKLTYGGSSSWHFPDRQDRFFVMPPPLADEKAELSPIVTTNVLYVAPAPTGSNANPGTADAPLAELQAAVNKAPSGSDKYTVIYAAAGDYKTGGEPYSAARPLTNRVNATRNVFLRGAGASQTFITGAEDPNGFRHNGPAAVRCVASYDVPWTVTAVGVQGFTLRNGHTLETAAVYGDSKTDATDLSGSVAAGGSSSSSARLVIADCDITGNGGTNNILSKVRCERCRIYGNQTGVGLVNDYSRLTSCLAYDNYSYKGASYIGNYSTVLNCTVLGETISTMGAGSIYGYNCIFDTAKGNYSGQRLDGSLLWNYVNTPNRYGAVYADPQFFDRTADDYRMALVSPARTCGVVPAVGTVWTNEFRYTTSSLDGERLVFNGTSAIAGALMKAPGGVDLESKGLLSVTKGGVALTDGYTLMEADDEITVAPIRTTHVVTGFTLNGVTNLFGSAASLTVKGTEVALGALLKPVYSPDLYVDASATDDSGTGISPATAKRTLSAILANALAGDTVHAAAGVYDEGWGKAVEADECRARAVVPAGVTLVSDEGASVTFIEGADAPEPEFTSGVGTNATRCVYLNDGACVRDFTLRKGRTACVGRGTDWGKTNTVNIGAAATGPVRARANVLETTRLEDCVITDCKAWRTGGAAYCTLVRCRLSECSSQDSSYSVAGTYNCRHRNSYLTGSSCTYLVMYAIDFINSTAVAPNASVAAYYGAWNDSLVVNSVVCGKTYLYAKQTVAPVGTYVTSKPNTEKGTGLGVLGEGCVITNADALVFDELGRPVLGQNVAIDGGLNSAIDVDAVGTTDLYGSQRVYNGTIDAGACEYDWRDQYTATVCRRFMSVTNASPEAVLADGAVALPNGSIAFAWKAPASANSAMLSVEVTGTGTLKVSVNGVVVATRTAADGRNDVRLNAGQGLQTVTCAYEPGPDDTGTARIYRLVRGKTGVVMFLR